jgi:predicted nucleotidyltransferase
MSLHFALEFDSIEHLINRIGNPIVIQKKTTPTDPAHELDARIVKTFRPVNPKKIILFGSVARKEADPFSDIDVIVVYPTPKRFLDRLEELYKNWSIPRAVDILAYTPEEYEVLIKENDFVREAVEKGRLIYEDV